VSTIPPGGYDEESEGLSFDPQTAVQNGMFCSSRMAIDVASKANFFGRNWFKSNTVAGSARCAAGIYKPGIIDITPVTTAITIASSGWKTNFLTNVEPFTYKPEVSTYLGASDIWVVFTSGRMNRIAVDVDAHSTSLTATFTTGPMSSLIPAFDYGEEFGNKINGTWIYPTTGDTMYTLTAAAETNSTTFRYKVSKECTKLRVVIAASRALWLEKGNRTPPTLTITGTTDTGGIEFDTFSAIPNRGFKTMFRGKCSTDIAATDTGFDLEDTPTVDGVAAMGFGIQGRDDWIDSISPANSVPDAYQANALTGAIVVFRSGTSTSSVTGSANGVSTVITANSNTGTYANPVFHITCSAFQEDVQDGSGASENIPYFDIISNVHRDPMSEIVILDSGDGFSGSSATLRPLSVSSGTNEDIVVTVPFDISVHSIQFIELPNDF